MKRTLNNDDTIALFPDESIDNVASQANSPLNYEAEYPSGPQNATAIPSFSAPTVSGKTAAMTDTANMARRESGIGKSVTSVAIESETPVLWVDMGFDMGYVC